MWCRMWHVVRTFRFWCRAKQPGKCVRADVQNNYRQQEYQQQQSAIVDVALELPPQTAIQFGEVNMVVFSIPEHFVRRLEH